METIDRLAGGLIAGLDLVRLEQMAGDLADCTLSLDHKMRACERQGDETEALEIRRTRRLVDHLYHLLCTRLDSDDRPRRAYWGGGQLETRPWQPEAREL